MRERERERERKREREKERENGIDPLSNGVEGERWSRQAVRV